MDVIAWIVAIVTILFVVLYTLRRKKKAHE